MEEMTLELFEEAAEAVARVTSETKLVYSEYYSSLTGNKVYFKPENMQYTGAYKGEGVNYGFCGKPCPGRGLRGKACRGKGNRSDAHDHTAD